MAVTLRCPECHATLGKDVENPVRAWCGECGTEFYNERGDRDGSEEEKEFIRQNKPKNNYNYFRL